MMNKAEAASKEDTTAHPSSPGTQVQMEDDHGTTSLGKTIFNTTKAAVGMGAILLLTKLQTLGAGTGLLLLFFFAAVCSTTVHFLSQMTVATRAPTYGALARHVLGPPGEIIAIVSLVLVLFGALMVFYLFLGKYGSEGTAELFGLKTPWPHWLVALALMVVPIFPLSCLKRLSALGTVSIIGMVIMALIALLLVVNFFSSPPIEQSIMLVVKDDPIRQSAFLHDFAPQLPWFLPLTPASSASFGAFLTILTNHFGIVGNVRGLRRPTPQRLRWMVLVSTSTVVVLNLGISWFAYAYFHNVGAKDPLDVPFRSKTFSAAKLGVAFNLCLTFPLILDSLRTAIDKAMCRLLPNRPTLRHYLETTLIVVAPYLLWLASRTRVIEIFDLLSALFRVFVVLLLPSMMFLKCKALEGRRSRLETAAAYGIIVLSVIICAVGPISPLLKMLNVPLRGPRLAYYKQQ
jgi:amino acid permease